jgi:UDP-GlcNAc:undecaprenyl-phosphate/decaprenyl-phosphate GlcNAc-1-phosphate transferase
MMRLKVTWMLMAVLTVVMLEAQVSAQEIPVLKMQKESYAVGVDLARNLKRQGIAADADALAKGVRDELSGAKLLMTEEDLRAALNEFQAELKQTRARAVRYVAQDNKIKGDAFLAENKAKEGVVSLPSGLQYKILKEGNGKRPTEADSVEVNYRGTLLDGTEFDNSYTRGQPGTFKVTGVIPGWKEALKLMAVGSKWQLFIPSELAYGANGHAYGKRGSDRRIIGPNETLIFELELLAIK